MLNTLIVEDNALYRQSLHHLLARRFPAMQIAEAQDAEDALCQALSRRFDLIFTDIRLPRGNGLKLTKTIKKVFVDSVICVMTSHAIPEYREAAFRSGADYFMVKDESTESKVVDLVESWLRTRYITLIIVNDSTYRTQLNLLLSIHCPAMVVAEVLYAATGLSDAAALKPNLLLLDLGLPCLSIHELVCDLRAGSPRATLIGMTDDMLPACWSTAIHYGVDYCVPLTSMGHTELVSIVNSILPERSLH